MARESRTRLTAQDWRHLLTVGALVIGVLGTLILGGRLRAEPSGDRPHDLAAVDPVANRAPAPAQPPPAQPLETRDPRAVSPPTARPGPDLTKAAPALPAPRPEPPAKPRSVARPAPATQDGAWTLQFMMTCKKETADRLARDLGHDSRLRLFPIRHEGRDCLRVCWGDFPTRESALAGDSVPGALLAVNGNPMARRTADLK